MPSSNSYSRYGKRFLDIAVAGFALLMLFPLMAVIAILVRCKLGKPIFFRQCRPGRNGKPFVLLKFRTMRDERDAAGGLLPDPDRQTSFGNFLRSSSMDELPELLNVLKGEMSLVGPRPLMMKYLPRYTREQRRRHEVFPGITGWAQINGRNLISWEQKFKLDLWYVDHVSLLLDLKILLLTFGKVIKRDGISAPSHFSTVEFNPHSEASGSERRSPVEND